VRLAESPPPRRGPPLLERRSWPLAAIVAETNKRSDNFFAETLLLTLGQEVTGRGDYGTAAKEVEAWVRSLGVPAAEFRMLDGSGLSRQDAASPRALVSLLRHMRQRDTFPVFRDSLAVAGQDGTLRNRMRFSPAQGKIMAKTGTLREVRALSGYVQGADGTLYAFALLANDYRVHGSRVKKIFDEICTVLTKYSHDPRPL